VAFPDQYWSSFEFKVGTLQAFLDAVLKISAYQAQTGTRFAWRGVKDCDYPLHSSLFRHYVEVFGRQPTERQLRSFETEIIAEARRWGLDWHVSGGRLTALELLAAGQHYGVPTRMLDFTFNPLIALWFAVEDTDHGAAEGRLFAIDIADREVTREQWMQDKPWWFDIDPGPLTEWTTQVWVWRPPPIEPRIVRQEACFLTGGVPSTVPRRSWRDPAGRWVNLRAAEVRASMSIPFQLITYSHAQKAFSRKALPKTIPKVRAFTLRVQNKKSIRSELVRSFGYSYESLFPDFPGFSTYGSFRRG
jgi:hypothetical protein